jgi:hypothetical protein
MSGQIPDTTVNVLRTFNDISINQYGIEVNLYIPNNLNVVETNDAYIAPNSITYTEYLMQKVWIEWFARDIVKLRKLGLFTEKEAPIVAWFKNSPEVILGSYIVVKERYIPDQYDTDRFEVVNIILKNTYSGEIYKSFKMAPRRQK